MQLKKLQQCFVENLISSETTLDPALVNEFHSSNNVSTVSTASTASTVSSVSTVNSRFECYRSNLHLRLIKVLKQDFPVCQRLVGEKFFHSMARHYIAKVITSHFNLNTLGRGFPTFIKHYLPAKSLVYLFEVAKFEWTIAQTFLRPANAQFDFEALSKIDPAHYDSLCFHLAETAFLFRSQYPIDKIWFANNETSNNDENRENKNGKINEEKTNDEVINLEEGGCYLIIFRKQLKLCIARLKKSEWALLKAFQRGKTLGEIAGQHNNNPSAFDLSLIQEFIKLGYVTRVSSS